MPDLNTRLRSVVGEKTAKLFAAELDVHTVGELLRHYPRRYATRGELTDLASLPVGEQATVLAQVKKVSTRRMRQKRGSITEVVVSDGSQTLLLTFFNQPWLEKKLPAGSWGMFAGTVAIYQRNRQLQHPDFRLLSAPPETLDGEIAPEVDEFAGEIIPVYPATKALSSWVISQAIRVALDTLGLVTDPVPDSVRERLNLTELRSAIRSIHRPTSMADVASARTRLAFDEAFAVQLVLARRRVAAGVSAATPRTPMPDGLLSRFDAACEFTLTEGQREVGQVIAAELADSHPMHRLLQGEVGSGKTIVALRAMLQVVDAGGQAVLLAPTEVLAAQHARTIRQLLGPLGRAGELDGDPAATRVALFTGSLGAAAKRQALAEIAAGRHAGAGVVVGTHALLGDAVNFADLGLVVVDEQHRFGVEQRDTLRSRALGASGKVPHVLVMTATPIPRTVAMTVFGDLDTSALTQLPKGRSPIATSVVPVAEKPAWLDRVWQRIREEVAAGHQAFVVCPRIGGDSASADDLGEPGSADDSPNGSPIGPPSAVEELTPMLIGGPLAGLRVGMLHGGMTAEDKDAAMSAFTAGKLDVLVATIIIEVGVDVPNATVMAIVDAGRFGVSQLHQLRGRVGRGSAGGLCLLVTADEAGTPARTRLDAVASTTDGFRLAELDLEQRREGDVLGAAQSGRRGSLKLLSLLRDADLIATARHEAESLIGADPTLAAHPLLAELAAEVVDDEQAEFLSKA